MTVNDLPALNACLNGGAAVMLLGGRAAIHAGKRDLHRALMLVAVTLSTLFLISYVTYHAQAGSTPFPGKGWTRPAYFTMLISHVVLAAMLLPLVIVTLTRALRGRTESHRRIARWTWPIWMYVSVTGVLIYVVLYYVYGAASPMAAET